MVIKSKDKQMFLISSLLLIFSFAIISYVYFVAEVVFAQKNESINVSRDVSATIDEVWKVVSDVDKESQYWSVIKNIKNLNTTGNIVEREITLAFNNAKAHQIVTLSPKNSIVINQTEGPITGIRTMTLNTADNDTNKTIINVSWDMDFSGIPFFAQGFAKENIFKSTKEALDKIADAVE